MTAPVYMTSKNGKNTMEFVLPSIYSEKNAVKPIDKILRFTYQNLGIMLQ